MLGWLVGWLVCWFVGLLVCWFVGLLVRKGKETDTIKVSLDFDAQKVIITFMGEPTQTHQCATLFEEFHHGLVVDRVGEISWEGG